jgi:ATP-dependent helicase/nuclease subunit B
VGLVESEWPERSRRNIFYGSSVMHALGWPSEKDRRAAADARFLDLLASPRARIELSTFMLDEEAVVSRSVQLDEVESARLSTITRHDMRSDGPLLTSAWDACRAARADASAPEFHGASGPRASRPWSVSALEAYLACPFKFFAQYILALEEEPDDEEVMDPRRQGQLVHHVFEQFFLRWQEAGHKAMTAQALPGARDLFVQVVEEALRVMPEAEAGLERTRLLGSPAAAGLGDAVFRMEAERETPVVGRLLEHELTGWFTLTTANGPRRIALRGKADRIDLLADDTFRLIDYKLGWPPDKSRALQLPIYALCAEQRLAGHRGRTWRVGEAMYLAFKGPRRVIPLFKSPEQQAEVMASAQQRLVDAVDAIERGEFPPSPQSLYLCDHCAFTTVCRKDYVGHV